MSINSSDPMQNNSEINIITPQWNSTHSGIRPTQLPSDDQGEGEDEDGGGEGWGLCGNETDPLFLGSDVNQLTVPINGYLSIIVVLLTIVTNCLVCLVLLKRNMRNATNAILVAMAMSTTLTGIWPIPVNVYFYALGGYQDWVPFEWCLVYSTLTEHLPTVFHTASIWLTVALAVQRYFAVCQSHAGPRGRWSSIGNAVKGALAIHALAAALHSLRFVEWTHSPVSVQSKMAAVANHVTGCCSEFTPFIMRHQIVYFNVYYCLRVFLVHLVPCTALVLLNALLVNTMRKAHARREVLLKLNRKSESRRLAESNSTTMMLVSVVGVFLLVELPMAGLFILLLIDNGFDLMILEKDSTSIASLLINFFILLSYPINFFIYCGMSRQFRETFQGLFGRVAPNPIGDRFERSGFVEEDLEDKKLNLLSKKPEVATIS